MLLDVLSCVQIYFISFFIIKIHVTSQKLSITSN